MEIELDLILNTTTDQLKSFCEKHSHKSIDLYRDNQIDRILGIETNEKIMDYTFHGVTYGSMDDNNDFDVNLARVAFVIERININEKKSKAFIRILNTYYGKEVKSLIKEGIPMKIIPIIDNTGHIHKLNITYGNKML